MSTATVASIGTLASQPREADVYYAFEVSSANHAMIVFRGYGINESLLREMRDRTRRFLTRHVANFKTSLVPVRVDNNRGGVYTTVPIYAGILTPELRQELIGHFAANGLVEWVNTTADPAPQPERVGKDKVVRVVNPADYTKKRIDRTALVNSYLKTPIGELADLCRQHGLNPSWSKVSMAAMLADHDIHHGQVSDEALLATEPEEVPAIPLAVEPTPAPVVEVPAPKPIYQQQLEEFVGNGRLNKLTKAQLVKLGVANGIFFNIKLTNRMPKSQLITILTESVQ